MEQNNCYLDYLLESLAWRMETDSKQLEKCDIVPKDYMIRMVYFHQQIINYAIENPPTDYLSSITVYLKDDSDCCISSIAYSYGSKIESPPFIAINIFFNESS